ncbi:hypothetical protein PFICI_03613 [Pestalotiopsis fici W106-1]|uniref:Amidase domain-containing protein n=1 Tax=Pestalotiopsis fici (strain W106-1 / CGMCC3.15140) TaxID=1229662 RepID=W3XHM9_PESFW|nr:uncharacterized protein PFICI_03613 [Pestalotiopsis fici W106-1]ETS85588.1 hypothetical protein PFICI_03613 [Pestalotiopsis fici W106-1]
MVSTTLPIVQPGSLPTGTPQFESLKRRHLGEFAAKVPKELILPRDVIENPPKDVTGIPASCGLLTPEEVEITEKYDATALAEAIAARKLTSVAVVTAFAKRAIIAHQLTCCLGEWFMTEAVARAKELDDHLAATGKTIGPLHGVPISVKEHIPVKGHSVLGASWDTRRIAKEDCHMISILREAGAVFYCKTMQPQALMHLETVSLAGRTLNPHNILLSAGGSTGGEGALVAMRGSVLGIGTDIGGSVRGPSGFCGIYGFKPTSYTLPMKDFSEGGFSAELNVLCSVGPMCTSARDMDLFMSVILSAKPYLKDPRIIPIPWTGLATEQKKTPLKIGFMMNDGVIEPQPPVTKGLQWVRERLQSHPDFEVKDFAPFKVAEAIKNLRLAYYPDGGKVLRDHFRASGEPTLPLTEWIVRDAEGDDIGSSGVLKHRLLRDDFRCDFAEHWNAQDVDIIICPVFVGTACSHETAFYWNYTGFWNYVDAPGVVIPTPIKAGPKGTETYTNQTPLSHECTHVRELWEEGDFEGAPVNIQICARKYHDNDLFAALSAIEKALRS